MKAALAEFAGSKFVVQGKAPAAKATDAAKASAA